MSSPATPSLQSFQEAFVRSADAMPAMRPLREQALRRFLDRGFPGVRDENWRYTNLRPLIRRTFSLAGTTQAPAEDILRDLRIDALQVQELLFVDGNLVSEFSSIPLQAGVSVRPINESEYLTDPDAETLHAFRDLNTAFPGAGCIIELEAGIALKQPFYLLFVSTATETPLMTHPRVVLKLGEGASAAIVEHHVSQAPDENLVNMAVDIKLAAASKLEHTRIQDASQKSFQICRIAVQQARDSVYRNHNISLGALLGRTDIDVRLEEPGAEVVLNGLLMGHGKQQLDTHTRVDHLVPRTLSREAYRSVMDEQSRGVFNGKVVVHKHAQKIEAHQASNNLLLSKKAEVDTKPELEIYADDVKCSHGATVGQLDKDAMFYLLSRGIDRQTARGLLVFAFADDIVAQLPFPRIRQAMERRIVGRLPDGDKLKDFV